MLKIFVGFIFALFDFNISGFDILADFVGYIMVYLGLNEFPDILSFAKAKKFAIILLAEALIECIASVMGFTEEMPFNIIYSALGIVFTVVWLHLMQLIIRGIEEIETNTKLNLDSAKLYSLWKKLTTLLPVTAVLSLASVLTAAASRGVLIELLELTSAALAIAAAVIAIITLVIDIKLLIGLNNVRKALDNYHPEETVPESFFNDEQQNMNE